MSFLAPLALFFSLTIPVVVVFYLLKRKRVVRLVSSTLLWQKFLAETQASAPFQKLRRNWLLILQILLLLLAVLALSRPYFASKAGNSDLRVMILDASASMKATDESPSRFEKARQQALEWVDSLREGDKMVILQAAANTEVKQSETGDKEALRRAIRACQPVDSPTRLGPALKMAESLVRDRDKESNPEIHLFSDGAFPDIPGFENSALPLIYHRIGTSANNVGITALDVRANPANATQRAVYVSVENFGTNTVDTDLELRLDGQLIETKPLKLPPLQVAPEIFFASQERDGIFSAHLTVQDDLAVDNDAAIVSTLPRPVNVLLVTRGNRLLERALKSAPDVRLAIATDLTTDGLEYDFVAIDDVVPTVWPKGNVLAIHVINTNWFEKYSPIESPQIVDWRHTHPLLHYVSFDNVAVKESIAVKTPAWGVSILDSQASPLIIAGELGRQRILWIGFDVLQSDWPLRISFPMFFQNAVEWLNPATELNSELLVHAGDPFRLGLNHSVSNATVTLPDGSKRDLKVDQKASEIVFADTFQQGTYHLRAGTNETSFCVALLDADESNIKPRDELQFGKYSKVSATSMHRTNMEIWRNFAALALAVLLFEWWYYHRRTV